MTPNDVFLVASDFSGNTYTSKVLSGLRYRLISDNHRILIPEVDYTKSEIGFTIISFNINTDSKITIQFY